MGRFCSSCGANIVDENAKFCDKCGASLGASLASSNETPSTPSSEVTTNNVQTNNSNTSLQSTKKGLPVWAIILLVIGGVFILGIILVVVFVLLFVGTVTNTIEDTIDTYEDITTTVSTANKTKKLDSAFEFDGLEITVGSEMIYTTIDNKYSSADGVELIGIPITVKNLSDDSSTLSIFDITAFGPKGTEIENYDYYVDDSLGVAGELLKDASYTKYVYFAYEGDGNYTLEFDNYDEDYVVEFSVTKTV